VKIDPLDILSDAELLLLLDALTVLQRGGF
jgi:hypothetical protein